MKRFIKKTLLLALPFIITCIGVQYLDFFKIYRPYTNYFNNNRITLNRTIVGTKTFLKYNDSLKYNAFIFGNSRAQAYKNNAWLKHLDNDASVLHFDSDNESIYGIFKKLEFLDKNNANIKNTLIVLDATVLKEHKQRNSYNYINPPEFNDVTHFIYYKTFFKTSCNAKFLTAVLDYNLFKTNRSYLKKYILTSKHLDTYNRYTLNCNYENEIDLKNDSILYYKKMKLKNAFLDRKTYKKALTISKESEEILIKISSILNKNNTNYKIIISPLYDQVKINKTHLNTLKKIFKTNNVFNFSGKNNFTNTIGNYYEWSHYKPFVAKQILDIMYKKKASTF